MKAEGRPERGRFLITLTKSLIIYQLPNPCSHCRGNFFNVIEENLHICTLSCRNSERMTTQRRNKDWPNSIDVTYFGQTFSVCLPLSAFFNIQFLSDMNFFLNVNLIRIELVAKNCAKMLLRFKPCFYVAAVWIFNPKWMG